MALVSVSNVGTPCNISVAGGFLLGMLVNIHGTVPKDSHRFDVNFLCGGNRMNEIAFHFKPLFKEDGGSVVFNSLINKQWGQEEERCSTPFQKEKSFQLQIVITKYGYKATVNNKHFYEFTHRVPLEYVKFLQVRGTVKLQKIEIFKDSSTISSTSLGTK